MKEFAPKLKKIVGDKKASAAKRIGALFALEGIIIRPMLPSATM